MTLSSHNPASPAEPVLRLGGTSTSGRWSEMPGNWDRLNTRALFASGNQWGIPDLPAAERTPARLVAYNDRGQIERLTADDNACAHFFLDDYRFETVWTKPKRPLTRLQKVGVALTPDFSLWRDMPLAMQLWQVYRARWCGAWMHHHGISVIPTISWSTPETFAFAFTGIPAGSVVAVSTVGIRDPEAKALFAAGYTAMLQRIRPTAVLVYGKPPAGNLAGDTPVHCYPTRWEKN